MRAVLVLVLVCAACGDDLTGPAPAAPDAGLAACTAALSGTLVATSSSLANCPTVELGKAPALGHRMLDFTIPTDALVRPLAISLDLGIEPAPGLYTSETIESWSALGFQMLSNGWCAYKAGSDATPQGSFTLVLDALDLPLGAAHGQLAIIQPVLPLGESSCGPSYAEQIDLRF